MTPYAHPGASVRSLAHELKESYAPGTVAHTIGMEILAKLNDAREVTEKVTAYVPHPIDGDPRQHRVTNHRARALLDPAHPKETP